MQFGLSTHVASGMGTPHQSCVSPSLFKEVLACPSIHSFTHSQSCLKCPSVQGARNTELIRTADIVAGRTIKKEKQMVPDLGLFDFMMVLHIQ